MTDFSAYIVDSVVRVRTNGKNTLCTVDMRIIKNKDRFYSCDGNSEFFSRGQSNENHASRSGHHLKR